MSVFTRGKIWQYDFHLRKIRYRGSLPECRNKTQAKAAESRIRDKIFSGKYEPAPAPTLPKLADWIKSNYLPWARENKKSHRDDETRAKALVAFFGNVTLDTISPFDLERYKRERRETLTRRGTKLSAASINHELTVLSGIYALAIREGHALTNPVSQVKLLSRHDKRERILSVAEEARLLTALDSFPRSPVGNVVRLALQTGMRRGELLNLRWPDVDFVRGVIFVRHTKTGRPRHVPINAPARELLLHLRDAKPFDVRPNKTGVTEFVLPTRTIHHAFPKACQLAKIPNLRFHDLRHTVARRLADAGMDAFTIAAILGHSTVQQTAEYANATGESSRRAMAALSGVHAISPTQAKKAPDVQSETFYLQAVS